MMTTQHEKLRAGDLVEVRSKKEILATLDPNGRLEGLPFMPQMFQYCGQQFQVIASAHKTCDVIAGEGRSLPNCVHLDIRCDGQGYGGCQSACLIFWKHAWLRRVDEAKASYQAHAAVTPSPGTAEVHVPACTESNVWRATKHLRASGEMIYSCQATRLPHFTGPLAWWDVRQYIEDYRSGNVSLARLACGFLYQSYTHSTQAWRHRLGRPARWVYDAFQAAIGGIPFPRKPGALPPDKPAPIADFNLQPGDLVRVKSHEDILATVTKGGMNRGLLFDKEMVPFCGRVFRVKTRVTTFVNESTGRLTTLKTPAVILEGVWCQSRYSNKKMFCPRALYSWWRDIWLERIPDEHTINPGAQSGREVRASTD